MEKHTERLSGHTVNQWINAMIYRYNKCEFNNFNFKKLKIRNPVDVRPHERRKKEVIDTQLKALLTETKNIKWAVSVSLLFHLGGRMQDVTGLRFSSFKPLGHGAAKVFLESQKSEERIVMLPKECFNLVTLYALEEKGFSNFPFELHEFLFD